MEKAVSQFVHRGYTFVPADLWRFVRPLNTGFTEFLRYSEQERRSFTSFRRFDPNDPNQPDDGYMARRGAETKSRNGKQGGKTDIKDIIHIRGDIFDIYREAGLRLSPRETRWLQTGVDAHQAVRTLLDPFYLQLEKTLTQKNLLKKEGFYRMMRDLSVDRSVLRLNHYLKMRDDRPSSTRWAQVGRSHTDRCFLTVAWFEGLADGNRDESSRLQRYFGNFILPQIPNFVPDESLKLETSDKRDRDHLKWRRVAPRPSYVLIFASAMANQEFGIPAMWHRILSENGKRVARRSFVHFEQMPIEFFGYGNH